MPCFCLKEYLEILKTPHNLFLWFSATKIRENFAHENLSAANCLHHLLFRQTFML